MIRELTVTFTVVAGFTFGASTPASAADCSGEGAGSDDYLIVEVDCSSPPDTTQVVDAGAGEVRLEYPMRCDDDTGACIRNETYRCPNPEDEYVIVWIRLASGDWQVVRQGCVPASGAGLPIVTDEVVLSALRRIGLPSLQVATTPAETTLVNLETVFSTSPSPVTRTLTLLGQSVEVEATPASYLWHFGDGQSASTNRPGSPYPAMDLTHRYAKAGVTVQPSVDTTYTARFRVNGGSWQDVNGTVTIVGPPTSLEVLEGTPVLSGNR